MLAVQEPMDIDNVEEQEEEEEEYMDVDNDENEKEEPMDIDNVEEKEESMNIDNEEEDKRSMDNLQHDAIRSFLQDFLINWKRGDVSTNIIRSCRNIILKKELSSINITVLNFTTFTFEKSLGKVCKELFRYKYKLEYVIVLLSFAVELDKHLQDKSWYNTQRLINVLAMELVNTPLHLQDIMDMEETWNYSMFLLIIPVLFMTCFLCK